MYAGGTRKVPDHTGCPLNAIRSAESQFVGPAALRSAAGFDASLPRVGLELRRFFQGSRRLLLADPSNHPSERSSYFSSEAW